MRQSENPYEECVSCKTVDDCKHADPPNGLNESMPPDNCPNPIHVMRRTMNKRKVERYKKLS